MIKTLILSHGELARELARAAETIAGKNPDLAALVLDWNEDFEAARARAAAAIAELAPEHGLLILTDIHGGTPYNVARSFYRPDEVEIIAGVNLPMVVRLGCHPKEGRSVSYIADWLVGKAKGSICRARSVAALAPVAVTPCGDE